MDNKTYARWHTVTMSELQAVWQYLTDQDICYNGCTHVELVRRYGEANLKHVRGYGWYKLVRGAFTAKAS